ncbi:MAG: tRNA (cytidine(34)-2'-O)-methyltransferase [Ruminococcus sp.]|jgi:tRNA (cytidine/uridine-2'-O-)-methyltransferase|nr:tRNA (cytidine(34)-2'-O)-methyltransferase [Ruminococcus sp.]
MNTLNIVLLEPQIPQNTGNISRTCAVTGASLHLIKPLGFEINDKTLKRAGLDYWDKLSVYSYNNFDDFKAKNSGQFIYYSTKAKRIYTEIEYNGNVYIIFGREDKGLPESLLAENYENCVRIPMKDDLRSLNLSNSVAIAAYEVLRCWNFTGLNCEGALTTLF